jgi:tetratricopeptide (TPR) repeat protein
LCWAAMAGLCSCSSQPAGKGPRQLLVADPPLGSGEAPGAGLADFDRGVALVKKEAYSDAIGYFDKTLAAKPGNAVAHAYRAMAKDRTGDRAGAEQDYKRALELDPKLLEAAINLGALYLDDAGGKATPQPDKAIELLSKAAEQAPPEDQADIRTNLAFAYRLTKNYDRAADQYRMALQRGEQASVRYAFGDMLIEAGRCKEAGEQLIKAAEGYREDAVRLAKLADDLGRCKAFDQCVLVLDMAVQREPTKPDWYVRRGVCRHGAGDEPKARADFEEAIKRDAKFAPAYYYLGMSYLADKQRLNASKALEKAAAFDRDGPVGKRAKEALDKMAAEKAAQKR